MGSRCVKDVEQMGPLYLSAAEAGTMYYALRKFGHHWKAPKAEPVKVGRDIVARAEQVNQGEINATRDWIRNSDPSLQQIEQWADQSR
jgi:hypothetical protein